MKVVVFEATAAERDACRRLAPAHDVECIAGRLTRRSAARYADAEVITTFIRSELSAAVLRRMPRLRLIATRSVGFDHIDLDHCRQCGITVCNAPDYADHTVAEHVFALLLALSRRIVEAVERTRRGVFSQSGLRGFDLADKTLGVVGVGHIGRRVISIGNGFGMKVIAFDRHPRPATARALGFRYAALDALLAASDVVTLHVAGGDDTHYLIGDDEFARMKDGAVLINTSRGGLVDSAALIRALASGRLGGAGLDVVAAEASLVEETALFRADAAIPAERLRALLADHAVISQPNVIVTPHIAYDTREAIARLIATTIDNIAAFHAGSACNVVGGPEVHPPRHGAARNRTSARAERPASRQGRRLGTG